MTTDEQKEIQEHIRECRKDMDMYEALERLKNNADFQKVFLQGYLHDESYRTTTLLADPRLNLDEHKRDVNRAELHELLIGIARFNAYMLAIKIKADRASSALEEYRKNFEMPTDTTVEE